ncbi:uncharacterized protein LOC115335098 [Aquila chrysaetos chrysaetos]|uniref:uncharacterized protein LOC115335098 n=1 Tax=Aquila chrysaetos chrysaetos TaxID=223781 RepID=UPI0011766604|nr:uncharacterized protein LOC115335098 [Aquila chrysaetos chrysaetos]
MPTLPSLRLWLHGQGLGGRGCHPLGSLPLQVTGISHDPPRSIPATLPLAAVPLPQPLLAALGRSSPCPTSPPPAPCLGQILPCCPVLLLCCAGVVGDLRGRCQCRGRASNASRPHGEWGGAGSCLLPAPAAPGGGSAPRSLLGRLHWLPTCQKGIACTRLGAAGSAPAEDITWGHQGRGGHMKTPGDMQGTVRVPVCPQHCPLERGECSRCPAPHAFLPTPSPSSAALAGGDAGAVGQGGHGWVLVCRWGDGERKFWGSQEGCAHLCHVMSCWVSAGTAWGPGQVAWGQSSGDLAGLGGTCWHREGGCVMESGQQHSREAAACPQLRAGGCRAPLPAPSPAPLQGSEARGFSSVLVFAELHKERFPFSFFSFFFNLMNCKVLSPPPPPPPLFFLRDILAQI